MRKQKFNHNFRATYSITSFISYLREREKSAPTCSSSVTIRETVINIPNLDSLASKCDISSTSF